jgi:hypothetical protein
MTTTRHQRYRPTEAKYRRGAEEMYVTYDLEQKTRSGTADYPKVKRVYVPGEVTQAKVGEVEKKSGKKVHGVRIDYEQHRKAFRRRPYTAHRGDTTYEVSSTEVPANVRHLTKVVEVPKRAKHVAFRGKHLPKKYQSALQAVK